jgi:hypothetical protein
MNVLYFIDFIVVKTQLFFLKLSVVGQTAPVLGRRPTMHYYGYATNVI